MYIYIYLYISAQPSARATRADEHVCTYICIYLYIPQAVLALRGSYLCSKSLGVCAAFGILVPGTHWLWHLSALAPIILSLEAVLAFKGSYLVL